MARFAAFLDACVLVPITPCDALLRMADAGAFRPLWSERVVSEAVTALARIHPDVDQSRFLSRFRSMDDAFDDACVRGWESIVESINLPDPDDRHVVAAALVGRADAIITNNINDFPPDALTPLGLEAITLDDYSLDLFDLNPTGACAAVDAQLRAMSRPPITMRLLLDRLSRSGAPGFARAIEDSVAL